ncbi:hypothetical protein P171DRAFT_478297 [Karstenula rhodostoma CBS 690.94]|uniref:Zinc finger PHD-type domain-containing protein n=1 Tax=Karstenula rhodostoma CBS 690.94 TaxID=1392251 RepID=A0A9P4UGM1_9PLEO|nr:hypothetical protein P171DRAFT_478297 [Karstenula rhodostoma CBS 690.94]
MGKDLLFRWEDCDALKHHCGFCDKPLSHPGAKTSCFGTHAEPCFRFHQVMFMRNRGHTCDMCMHIDEHHYKRHFEMCEQVRTIYDSCGEDWPLIPEDEEDRGRSMARGSGTFDSDGLSSTSGDVPLKKRDRKEQKRQIRAASRTKVVTLEDTRYIDSILHPAAIQEGIGTPANPEEIEEIEQHLKYNAQCYNHGQKRSNIRQFARIPDADIDFGAEIDRIFESLRVNELLKRNERNRGLRNRDLANFKTLVSELKEQVITDLVQRKKDELEIRMRRAAFLRYTNRASFDIVSNRYADKDWKTGEKYKSAGSGSASSGSLTAVEEDAEEDLFDDQHELRNLSTVTLHDADRRHIERSHKKLRSDGLLEEIVAVKEIRDRTDESTSKPPPALRIVNTNIVPPQKIKFFNPWKQRNASVTKPFPALKPTAQNLLSSELIGKCPAPDEDDQWQTVGPTTIPNSTSSPHIDSRQKESVQSLQIPASSSYSATPKAPWHALKPTRVGISAWMDQDEADRSKMAGKLDREEKQARLDAQAQIEERKTQLKLAESLLHRQKEERKLQKLQNLQKPTDVAELPDAEHTAVKSQKKKDKKKKREALRKARRAAEKKPVVSELVRPSPDGTEADSPAFEVSPIDGVCGGGGLNAAVRDLCSPSREGSTSGAEFTNTADGDDGDRSASYGGEMIEGIEHTVSALQAQDEGLSGSSLQTVPSTRYLSPVRDEPAPGSSPKPLKDLSEFGSTATGVAHSKRNSVSFGAPKSSTTIPTTKVGRHRDWYKFTSATKVDSVSRPLFTPDHPAYNGTTTTCWWIGECPYEASGTPDCPYHRMYCKCVDPTEQTTFQYIVYAESHPSEIGPFNYMQCEKLMKFFKSQPDTKGKLMLVDEDLFTWLCTVGRHWRIESMAMMKKLDKVPMPKRLSWEVDDYVRGYQKGRMLKQVDLFQDLADRNERLAAIGCRAGVTKRQLEALRKKCETGPEDEAICYCQANIPEHPEDDDDLIECMFRDCPIKFFHRRCVEKLGYDKVTTWYCGWCEKNLSVAAQKAMHGAQAISMQLPAPDFESLDIMGEMRYAAKRSDMLLTGHCEK